MMKRSYLLAGLAALTVLFLGAAYLSYYYGDEADPLAIAQAGVERIIQDTPQAATPVISKPLPEISFLRLTVREAGIARLTESDLRAINFPLADNWLEQNSLSLTRDGLPVPLHIVQKEGEAVIYFYAEPMTNTLTAPAVYRLEAKPGQMMPIRSAPPSGEGNNIGQQTLRWEEQRHYVSHLPSEDLWLGPLLFTPDSHRYRLDDLAPNSQPTKLRVRFWSNTNSEQAEPDHVVSLKLNDRLLHELTWDGIRYETEQIDLSTVELDAAQENALSISTEPTNDGGSSFYIDWVELTYSAPLQLQETPLTFISDAPNITLQTSRPDLLLFEQLPNGSLLALEEWEQTRDGLQFAAGERQSRYMALLPEQALVPELTAVFPAATTLKTPEQGADYIAIVPTLTGFPSAIAPLLEHREAQGLQTTAVSLNQIYDEFSYSRPDPAAIRAFLQYAVAHWEPAPRYVLLVGDATVDLHGNGNGRNPNLLPTSLQPTSFNGRLPSDGWFGLDENDQPLPLAIGRFPVQTVAELETAVAKTIAHEAASQSGQWAERALLIADDEARFDITVQRLADQLQAASRQVQRLHMSQNENIHYQIISSLNVGVGLVSYVGHGSEQMWGDEGVFQIEDVANLKNDNGRLPIFLTFTCNNGAFAHLNNSTLAESLLLAESGGIVAAIAPSGRTPTDHQLVLASDFQQILLSSNSLRLGDALATLQASNSDSPTFRELAYTLNLLGDPALLLPR